MKRYMLYMLAFLILNALLSIPLSGLADVDTWTERADMPTARFWSSTSAVYGKLYAIGGQIDGRPLSMVEEYDTGFAVEAEGKLVMSWGKVKVENQKGNIVDR